MKKSLLIMACLGFLVAVFESTPVMAQGLKKHKIVIPRNSVFVLNYFGARDAGIYRKHGIDLEIDARPFKGFAASLPAKATMATTYPGTAAIARINKGMDMVVIGGGLTVMQEVFVLKNAPFKTISDLRGKKFASWSTGAGAFKATRAAMSAKAAKAAKACGGHAGNIGNFDMTCSRLRERLLCRLLAL